MDRPGEIVQALWNSLPERSPRLVLEGPASAGKDANGRAGTVPAAADAAATNDSLAAVAGAFKSISSIQVNRLCEEKLCTYGRRRSSEYPAVHRGEFLELGVGCRESRCRLRQGCH